MSSECDRRQWSTAGANAEEEQDTTYDIGATGVGYIAKGLRRNTGLVKLSLPLCLYECDRRQ